MIDESKTSACCVHWHRFSQTTAEKSIARYQQRMIQAQTVIQDVANHYIQYKLLNWSLRLQVLFSTQRATPTRATVFQFAQHNEIEHMHMQRLFEWPLASLVDISCDKGQPSCSLSTKIAIRSFRSCWRIQYWS